MTGAGVHTTDTQSRRIHSLQIDGFPPSPVKKGTVVVVTDHPAQSRVKLPFVVLD